jgi:hypothetical protein
MDQEKRRPGRPRKWENDAQRVAYKRIEEREQRLEIDGILKVLRSGWLTVPNMTGRETDAQLLKLLRYHLEDKAHLAFSDEQNWK